MFTIIQNIVVCFAAGLVNFGQSVTKRAVLESELSAFNPCIVCLVSRANEAPLCLFTNIS